MSLIRRLSLSPLLVLGTWLGATHCGDPLAGDCELTLSCGDAPQYTLDENCRWHAANGDGWDDGPYRDENGIWRWPNGTRSAKQDYVCGADADAGTIGGGGAGGSSLGTGGTGGTGGGLGGQGGTGPVQPDTECPRVPCAPGLFCNTNTGRCGGCTEESQCGAAHCRVANGAGVCVQCLADEHCVGFAAPRCDMSSNTCAGCTDSAQCTKITGLEQCLGTPAAPGTCVQCIDNSQCEGNPATPQCDPSTHTCVQCLNHGQCTDRNASQCDAMTKTCVGCTDGSQCETDAALCREGGRCVQCISSQDQCGLPTASFCSPDGDCVECQDNTQCHGPGVCDTSKTPNTCVECVSDADCPVATESQCVNNVCVECQNNDDCIGQPEGGICDTSANPNTCVRCTGTQDDACGQFVCDSRNRRCSTTVTPGSAAEACSECISDSHCAAGRFCVEQFFPNDPPGQSIGFFCLAPSTPGQPNSACATVGKPFARRFETTTIDQVAVSVCGLNVSTCIAHNQLIGSQPCASAVDDASCGVPGVDDAACDVAGLGFRCSMICDVSDNCPGSLLCSSGVCNVL